MKASLTSISSIPFLLIAIGVIADDGSWTLTGQGRTVMPLQSTQVRMASETVTIRPVSPRTKSTPNDVLEPYYEWVAECTFTFQNTADIPADILMGFPDSWVEDSWRWEYFDGDEPPPTHAIRDFEAKVDGEVVPVQARDADEGMRKDWPDISRVFCWNVHFKPGQVREVRNRYRFGGLQDVNSMGENFTRIEYVLRTGALWNGPIGSAEIRIYPGGEWRPGSSIHAMPHLFLNLMWRHAVLAPCGFVVEWKPEPCFVWRMKDLVPKEDIQAILVTAELETLSLYNTPSEEKSFKDLRVLKNTVFAAHGKSFQDPKLKMQFDSVAVGPQTPEISCKIVPASLTHRLYPGEESILKREYDYLKTPWYRVRPEYSEQDVTKPEWEFIAEVDRWMAESGNGEKVSGSSGSPGRR